jgi:hypothetical protein
MSPALKEFLSFIRSNPNFPELVRSVERPKISPFRQSEAEQSEKARAKWIFESGKLHQHEAWLALLTGKSTSEQE